MAQLTFWQRVHRRISLLGGGYRHPDGSYEFDFEAKAGVDHYNDDEDTKEEKVDLLYAKQAKHNRIGGALCVGLGVYLLTRPDASPWTLFLGALAVVAGIYWVAQ